MNSESTSYYLFKVFNKCDGPTRGKDYIKTHTTLGSANWVADEDSRTIDAALAETPHQRDLVDPMVATPAGIFWIDRAGVHPKSQGLMGVWRICANTASANEPVMPEAPQHHKDTAQLGLFSA